MKTIIAGRVATGKTTLADILTNTYGWHIIQLTDSYLTIARPENILQLMKDADGIIADPEGIHLLMTKFPEIPFELVYLKADKNDAKYAFAKGYQDPPSNALLEYKDRYNSQNLAFAALEDSLKEGTFGEGASNTWVLFENTYQKQPMEELAQKMENRRHLYQNLMPVIDACAAADIIRLTDEGKIKVTKTVNGELMTVDVTKEGFAHIIANDREGFDLMLSNYLSLSHVSTQKLEEPQETTIRSCVQETIETMVKMAALRTMPDADRIRKTVDTVSCSLESDPKFKAMIRDYVYNTILLELEQ